MRTKIDHNISSPLPISNVLSSDLFFLAKFCNFGDRKKVAWDKYKGFLGVGLKKNCHIVLTCCNWVFFCQFDTL